MENDAKTPSFFRFEDLRVYHKALDYAAWTQLATAGMPASSSRLRDVFQQAALNIAIQIAEGSARNKNQFIYYLKVAKSSVRECLVHTSTLGILNFLDERQEAESRNELMELTKMIGALIGSLMRASSGYEGEDEDDFPGHPEERYNR
jgi:four helix bundle protein